LITALNKGAQNIFNFKGKKRAAFKRLTLYFLYHQ
jgi:hypothetical protein